MTTHSANAETGTSSERPSAPLTAMDRGKPVDLSLKTLDHGDARRLRDYTERLLTAAR